MFGIYIIFGILTVFIWIGTAVQTFKTFKAAGIKGKAVFISIISVLYIIAFAVPIIFGKEAFFGINPDSKTEGAASIITLSSFFGVWLIASIITLIGRKYANNHMPVFAPTQVIPNMGIMGNQGYSAPVYPAAYPQQAPPNQYYGYAQGTMPSAPQGYPAPVAYPDGQNPYGQVPMQNQTMGYAPYPYAPNGMPAQEQGVPVQQPAPQANEENPQ